MFIGIGLPVTLRASAIPFEPTDLSSLVAWYDADLQAEADDAKVATLVDQFAAFDFTQSTDGLRPNLRYAEINGRKALEFVGSTGQNLTNTGLMDGATAGSYFVVLKRAADPPVGNANAGPILAGFTSAGSDSHLPFTDGVIHEAFGTSSRKTVGNPTPALTDWRIYSAHSAASDYRAYLDGTQLFSTGTNTVGFNTSTRRIGGQAATFYFTGFIAEILIFSAALTTGERQKVEGYLAHRYALTANLPSDHPYKAGTP